MALPSLAHAAAAAATAAAATLALIQMNREDATSCVCVYISLLKFIDF